VGYAQIGQRAEMAHGNNRFDSRTAAQLGVGSIFRRTAKAREPNQSDSPFIAMKVDVNWHFARRRNRLGEVFQEVKDAGIPLILVDRRAAVPDNMYVSYLGSDFIERRTQCRRALAKVTDGKARIVELVGTVDSALQ